MYCHSINWLVPTLFLGACAVPRGPYLRDESRDLRPASPHLPARRTCAGQRCGALPLGPDGQTHAVLFQLWSEEAGKVRASFPEISNRSELFGPDIARLERMFDRMDLVEQEGLRLVEAEMYEDASARLAVLMVELRVLTLQLNYLILASRADDAGMVSTHWMDVLSDMDRRTGPILDALWSYNRRHVEAAFIAREADLRELDEALPHLYATLRTGAEWSRRGIMVADGVSLAISAAQLGAAAAAGPRGGPMTFQFPGLVGVGAGGASTMGTFVISAEALEAIRRLIKLGAINQIVLSAGLGPTFSEPAVVSGPLLMVPTPSGTFLPEQGDLKGQRVSYGDQGTSTRGSHISSSDN